MRARLIGIVGLVAALVFVLVWHFRPVKQTARTGSSASSASSAPAPCPPTSDGSSPTSPTIIYAHNVLLRKGHGLGVYISWLHGQMTRAHANVVPSFDDPASFFLDIKTGVLQANLGQIASFLNAGGLSKSPLRNISLSGNNNQLKLTGTLHKVLPLPVEMTGEVSALPDGRIQLHATKIGVVKIPMKALLRNLNVSVADLFGPKSVPGIQVSGNDIVLDPTTLMPPPHIRGHLTDVQITNSSLEEVYGNSRKDETRVEQWRNFLRLRDGTISFGKLTMNYVDLIMIDVSSDEWFDLDLAHYQEQLVNGYTRVTPQAGLQIFMPDFGNIPQNEANANIGIEWMKNRNIAPPEGILGR